MSDNKKTKSKLVLKIILYVILGAVVVVGVIGTVWGVKDTVNSKKEDNTTETTTESIKLDAEVKTFSGEDFEITLTEDFEEKEDPAVEGYYTSEGIAIFIMRETFEDYPETKDMSIKEYAKYITELNGEDSSKVVSEDGLCYTSFLYNGSGEVHEYKVFMFKGEDSFWNVHFTTGYEDAKKFEPYILEWAKSIKVK